MDTKEAYAEKMVEALKTLTKELGGLCSQMDTLVQEAGKLVQEYRKSRQTADENLTGPQNGAEKVFAGTEAGPLSGKYSKLLLDYAAADIRADETHRAGGTLWRTQWTGILAAEKKLEDHIRVDVERLDRKTVEVSARLVIALKTVDSLPKLRLQPDEFANQEAVRKSFAEDVRLTMGNRLASGKEDIFCFYTDARIQGARPIDLFDSMLGERKELITPYKGPQEEAFPFGGRNAFRMVDSWVDPARNDRYTLWQSYEKHGAYMAVVNGQATLEYDKKPARSEVMAEYHDRLIYSTPDHDREKGQGKEGMASQGPKEAAKDQAMIPEQEIARRR